MIQNIDIDKRSTHLYEINKFMSELNKMWRNRNVNGNLEIF